MSGNGDIGELVGIADTIASPAGTITTRPLIPASWQTATPTLSIGTVTTPPEQGGLESDAPKATDPDQFVGSLALAAVTPTLATGSTTAPAGNGDVGDVFGAPDLAGEAQAKGLVAFQFVTPTLTNSVSPLPPIAHGDVGDTGGPTTLQGDTNDSNAGAGTLLAWAQGSPTLATGSIPQVSEHGDIGEMYGLGEGPIGQAVWNGVSPTLTIGAVVPAPFGQGGLEDDQLSAGYGTVSEVFLPVASLPILSDQVTGGTVVLTWTPLVASLPTHVIPTYTLWRSLNGGAFTAYQIGLTGLTFTDTGLVRGFNTYSYYIETHVPQVIAISNTVSAVGAYADVYTVAGTYTWTKRVGAILLDFPNWVGPGGGGYSGGVAFGPGSGNSGGGSGSGGGYAQIFGVSPSQVSSNVTVTIGAFGLGGARGTNTQNSGTSATQTSFGSYITCNGGIAGLQPQSGGSVPGGTASIAGITGSSQYVEQGGRGVVSGGQSNFNGKGGSTTLAPAGGGAGAQGDLDGGGSGNAGGFGGAGGDCGSLAGGLGGVNMNGNSPSGGGAGLPGISGTGEGPGVSNCGSGGGASGNRMDYPIATGTDSPSSGLGAGGAGGGDAWAIRNDNTPGTTAISGAGSNGGAGYGKVITYMW